MSAERRCRTYLAVPAHRAEMVGKAAASGADAVFMDLEDAVPPAEKATALAGACAALDTLDWGNKLVAVRINPLDSVQHAGEVEALAGLARLDALIVPKAEQAAAIAGLGERLRALGAGRAAPVAMELLIETARGLIEVERLAAADPLVAGLHFGAGDFAASIGARTAEIGVSPAGYRHRSQAGEAVPLDLFAYPMMRILVAARAFGLRAIDAPYGGYADEAGTAASAGKAAAMGFDGKQVIHPRQIAPTRQAFVPTDAELAYARRVEAAMRAAQADGQGAVAVDGRMLDEASLRLVMRVLRQAD